MRTKLLAAVAALTALTVTAECLSDDYVRGYQRRDGTYVEPHWRSTPDTSYNNNWSVRPNQNPYTYEYGTRSPTSNDRAPVPGFGAPFQPNRDAYGNPVGRYR